MRLPPRLIETISRGLRRKKDELIELAKELDKHYIPPRYPNSYPVGLHSTITLKEKLKETVMGTQVVDICS